MDDQKIEKLRAELHTAIWINILRLVFAVFLIYFMRYIGGRNNNNEDNDEDSDGDDDGDDDWDEDELVALFVPPVQPQAQEPAQPQRRASMLPHLQDMRAHQAEEHFRLSTGIDLIPSAGDYSLYDHVLDCACLFNAIPTRYKTAAAQLNGVPSHLRLYFDMARGLQEKGTNVSALPMKKRFDTNYNFIVPELSTNQTFLVGLNKPLKDFLLAKCALNLVTKPVLVGPVSFLHLSRVGERKELATEEQQKVVQSLVDVDAKWIQIDEPIFSRTFAESETSAYYDAFRQTARTLHQLTAKKEYLSQKGFVHRDVAARNILVQDKTYAKIGDFGLCRFIYADSANYKSRGGRLPIKWMAPEAIRHYEFTTSSDV